MELVVNSVLKAGTLPTTDDRYKDFPEQYANNLIRQFSESIPIKTIMVAHEALKDMTPNPDPTIELRLLQIEHNDQFPEDMSEIDRLAVYDFEADGRRLARFINALEEDVRKKIFLSYNAFSSL